MLIKLRHISDSTRIGLQYVKPQNKSQILFYNPSSKISLKEKQGFQTLRRYSRLQRHDNNRRNYVVYNSVEPGIPPSGPPPNIISWILAAAIAIVIPLINYKWGPSLKSKEKRKLRQQCR